MINMKKQAFNAAAILALTASAASHSALLVPNGDFESNFDSWGYEFGGGGSYTVEATGGNTGGYLQMNQATGWGAVAISTDSPVGGTLAEFGLDAGQTTADVQWDQKLFSGAGGGMGVKIESWNETAVISDSGDQFAANTGSGWETFSYSYTIAPGATRLKVVLLGVNIDSVMGYDNVTITNAVPVPAAAWLFGSALAGLVAVRRKK
ncbi:VPLPA-CTERM sorting domain-containing protein [Pseudomonadales bacterium]|nr:VPLPA-CTERM sorting domain-containing protein [bacterium]MDB4806594.1 VPLPA-CTERM sorting domain-containing protein [Pseudomonadales bacterium]